MKGRFRYSCQLLQKRWWFLSPWRYEDMALGVVLLVVAVLVLVSHSNVYHSNSLNSGLQSINTIARRYVDSKRSCIVPSPSCERTAFLCAHQLWDVLQAYWKPFRVFAHLLPDGGNERITKFRWWWPVIKSRAQSFEYSNRIGAMMVFWNRYVLAFCTCLAHRHLLSLRSSP